MMEGFIFSARRAKVHDVLVFISYSAALVRQSAGALMRKCVGGYVRVRVRVLRRPGSYSSRYPGDHVATGRVPFQTIQSAVSTKAVAMRRLNPRRRP